MLYFSKQGSTSSLKKMFCQVQNKRTLYSNFHALPIMPTSSHVEIVYWFLSLMKKASKTKGMKEWKNEMQAEVEKIEETKSEQWLIYTSNGTTLANFLMP